METLLVIAVLALIYVLAAYLYPTTPIPGNDAFRFRKTFGFSPRGGEASAPEERIIRTVLASRLAKFNTAKLNQARDQKGYDEAEGLEQMKTRQHNLSETTRDLAEAEKLLRYAVNLAVSFHGMMIVSTKADDLRTFHDLISERAINKHQRIVNRYIGNA